MDDSGHKRSFLRKIRPASGDRKETAAGSGRPRSDGAPTTSSDVGHSHADESRARIVVPRQERGDSGRHDLDIDLREIRYGAASKGAYLRVVPKQRQFTRTAEGYLEATRLASRPRGPIENVVASFKRVFLGNPFASSQIEHEKLTKVKALAIFSSDALSSSAYATQEILIVLVLAGSGVLHNSLPIAAVIALLLTTVTISYRQTIKAYPSGGGAYIVAHENLGRPAGLTAGAALLVDYVLTVSVSVAAGVAAVTSAFPDLHDVRVPIGVAVIGLITLGNLRGIREAGTLFAIPTYFFIFSMTAVIVLGFADVAFGGAPGSLLHEAPPEAPIVATQGLTLFLVLRAFSAGCAALTGIEAISNGVPAFKSPEVPNARATMAFMAGILAFLFLGITFLTSRYGFVATPDDTETIVSKLGAEVLGKNALYYMYQAGTALVLFLAANTSYNGFPPLSAILARDRFLPRQLNFRGDRLAYSNSIMILAAAAAFILIIFSADVNKLIPLYALGVFVSFTLSQTGMIRHLTKLKEPGWQTGMLVSGMGALATGIVAVIIGATKFVEGAWLSVLMMAGIMLTFALIRRHYDWFEAKLYVDESELPSGVPAAISAEAPRDHVIVPVDGVNKISLGAIGMAREISNKVTAVHLTDDKEQAEEFRERWDRAVPDVPLLLIESPYRAFVAPMLKYLEVLDEQQEQRITVILPTFVPKHWWERILHNRDVLRLRPYLTEREGIRVVDFPYRLYERRAD